MTSLGKYFTSDEFGKDLSATHLNNYLTLVLWVLDPVRERFGVTTITSGYRTEEHNREVGGAPSSQHVFGEACDFWCPYAETMGLVYRFILDELQFPGEVIFYKKDQHIHIGLPRVGLKSDHFINEQKA